MTIYELLDTMVAAMQDGVTNGSDFLDWVDSDASNADIDEVLDGINFMTWQSDDGSLKAAQETLSDDRFSEMFDETRWYTRDVLFANIVHQMPGEHPTRTIH